jgi:hypothetical protein
MSTGRSVCRAGAENQGASPAAGVALGNGSLLGVADEADSGVGLDDGGILVGATVGLGFAAPAGRVGLADARTDADGDGDGRSDAWT